MHRICLGHHLKIEQAACVKEWRIRNCIQGAGLLPTRGKGEIFRDDWPGGLDKKKVLGDSWGYLEVWWELQKILGCPNLFSFLAETVHILVTWIWSPGHLGFCLGACKLVPWLLIAKSASSSERGRKPWSGLSLDAPRANGKWTANPCILVSRVTAVLCVRSLWITMDFPA